MKNTKILSLVFLIAFLLNVVWENIHSLLYTNYQGGAITEFILVRASLFDAAVITVMLLPFLFIPLLKKHTWLILIIGTIIAITNEWYGLSTARWAYGEFMPILPLINTGLTPTLQLGLLGFATYYILAALQARGFIK